MVPLLPQVVLVDTSPGSTRPLGNTRVLVDTSPARTGRLGRIASPERTGSKLACFASFIGEASKKA
jgi:hypothetical protein